jgi:catechol 2,3-dioxygenase-like lactoylglutathione lyase family enzyme
MAAPLDTVFVWVTDLERSIAWYAEIGITAGPGHGDWQTMETAGPTQFALHRGIRQPGPSTGGIAFGVDDLDSEIARLTDLGIEPVDESVTDTGVSRFITFRDPDGNDIQLLERHG